MSNTLIAKYLLISLPHATKIMKRLQQKQHSAKAGYKWNFDLEELPGTYGSIHYVNSIWALENSHADYKSSEQMYRLVVYRQKV